MRAVPATHLDCEANSGEGVVGGGGGLGGWGGNSRCLATLCRAAAVAARGAKSSKVCGELDDWIKRSAYVSLHPAHARLSLGVARGSV